VACKPIGKKIALVQCAASAARTARVFLGQGPSSKVSCRAWAVGGPTAPYFRRIFQAHAAPVGSRRMWTLAFDFRGNRTPTHGYDATREAAIAASPPRTRTEPGLTEIYNAPIVSGRRGPASLR
jgi:hypothetical protein